MTDITEIKRDLEALNAKVAKLEAERAAPRRNWPENVEAGMVFEHRSGAIWVVANCAILNTETGEIIPNADGINRLDPKWFAYKGRDILTIRTDAHEPTGAELVGKSCRVSLCPIEHDYDGFLDVVTHYDETKGYTSQNGIKPWKHAKLAR